MSSRLAAECTLDQIDDYFKIGKKVDISTVPRSKLGGRLLDPKTGGPAVAEVKPYVAPYKRHARANNPRQTAYARDVQIQEEREMMTKNVGPYISCGRSESSSVTGHMDRIDLESTITGMSSITMPEGMTEEDALNVYSHYSFSHKYDENLSITKHREEIVRTIENNRVTIIEGETGSGKTTQVAQYILDEYAKKKSYCNIVVTQPRRIAAMSICRRVCQERNWEVGTICGYQIGMDKTASEDTRLLYCTTGILLQKLINNKHMREFTHIILDEVHERDQDSDFAMLVVRKFLRTNSPGVKVVLMSATIQTELFADYFAVPVGDKLYPSPILKVKGRTYEVREFYLEDLRDLPKDVPMLDPNKPSIPDELNVVARKLLVQFDRLEIPLYGELQPNFSKSRGSVLIFLPGLHEITQLYEELECWRDQCRFMVITLHSSLPGEDQVRVFNKPSPGVRKIILSTNIAESSITVPDIRYVIDFCLTKNLVCDPETNYSSLQVQWASHANCKQRKGRAGRVSHGRVYRLVTRQFYEDFLPRYGTPEMLRCPLERLVLQTKKLDIGEPKAILGLALDPPCLDDLERTILMLKEVGALSTLTEGHMNIHDGELTFLGKVLASLQVDIRLGKLIMLGYVFGVLDDCIIIAASMNLRSFFCRPFKGNIESYKRICAWADHSFSDCIAALNAFKVWDKRKEDGVFGTQSDEYQWGRDNFVQIRNIRDVKELVMDLYKRLREFNIVSPIRQPNREPPNKENQELILKLVMCGAFYPNYFEQGEMDEEAAIRFISGRNPFTTVQVRGLPPNQGSFYRDQIEAKFQHCDTSGGIPKVHFEETRAYIEFAKDLGASKVVSIPISVYLAIKLRKIRLQLTLTQYSEKEIAERMNRLAVDQHDRAAAAGQLRSNIVSGYNQNPQGAKNTPGEQQVKNFPRNIEIPKGNVSTMKVYVTHIKDCCHFWVHFADPDSWNKMNHTQKLINTSPHLLQLPDMASLTEGMYCLAPFQDVDAIEYYRAKILAIKKITAARFKVKVIFLDYGNISIVNNTDIRQIEERHFEAPFMAVQCSLTNVHPSPIKCAGGIWTEESIDRFAHLVEGKTHLVAKIFSVVDDVMRVDLYDEEAGKLHINQKMVDDLYAEQTEETLQSKMSNKQREEEYYSPVSIFSENRPPPRQTLRGAVDEKLHKGSSRGTRNTGRQIYLQGPWNPYEMDFYSITNLGQRKNVRIDNESVNSVALDDEPQTPHSRLMVAAYVGLNPTGDVMQARSSTIMPKIPGLPSLVALMFTPSAELRVSRDQTHYTGALCGLGYDEENEGPALPDHDMEVMFDVKIDLEDIGLINNIRLAINLALSSESAAVDWGPQMIQKIQYTACERMLKLVKKRRKAMEQEPFRFARHWNKVNPRDVLKPSIDETSGGTKVYILHNAIALFQEDENEEEEEYDEQPPVQLNPRPRQREDRIVSHQASYKAQMSHPQQQQQQQKQQPSHHQQQQRSQQQQEQQQQQDFTEVEVHVPKQQRWYKADDPHYQQQQQRQQRQQHPLTSCLRPTPQSSAYSSVRSTPQNSQPPTPQRAHHVRFAPSQPGPVVPRHVEGAVGGVPQRVQQPAPRPAQVKPTPEQCRQARLHLKKLKELATSSTVPTEGLGCKICSVTVRTPKELQFHLQELLHKKREQIIFEN